MRTIQTKCQEDKINLVPRESRTDAKYADYAQNLDIPHFGSEHPGDTQYFLLWESMCLELLKQARYLLNYDDFTTKKE